jgi:hypothetical protein
MRPIPSRHCACCGSSPIRFAHRRSQFCGDSTRSRNALASRRLFLLQGLPGVGPALAHRLLGHFGSIERIVTADTRWLDGSPRCWREEGCAHPGARGGVILSGSGEVVTANGWLTTSTAVVIMTTWLDARRLVPAS